EAGTMVDRGDGRPSASGGPGPASVAAPGGLGMSARSAWLATWRGRQPGESEVQAIKLDRQSVAPAVLAAVGEAAVLFLPLKALAVDGVDATGGPLRDYPLFLALFVGAVALSTALRRFKAVPSIVAVAAVAVGVVQSVAWGSGTVFGMVMGVI